MGFVPGNEEDRADAVRLVNELADVLLRYDVELVSTFESQWIEVGDTKADVCLDKVFEAMQAKRLEGA